MHLPDVSDGEEKCSQFLSRLTAMPFYSGGILSGIIIWILYVLLGEWSYLFVIPPSSSAIFWLPSSISVALFIRARNHPKLWLPWVSAIFFSEFYLIINHNLPTVTAFFWATSNIVLAITVTFIARKSYMPCNFRQVRDVLTFAKIVIIAIIPSSIVAAFGATIGFVEMDFISFFVRWSASDSLGIIIGAPVILSFTVSSVKPAGSRNEGILLIFLLLALSIFTLSHARSSVLDRSFFTFLILFVAWAAIRFGPRWTSMTLLVIDLIQVWVTTKGYGTFAYLDLNSSERLFTLQVLVANIGFLMLLLAAAIEEQRLARLKAEQALNLRDDFISVASHELKTPLSSLMMQIQLIQMFMSKGDSSSDKVKTLINNSEHDVRRFSYLVNELLDVSRISAGRLILSQSDVSLLEIVQTVVNRFSIELEQSGCVVSISGDQDIRGFWDRSRIEQIITNLLTNAMKFGAGKPIDIKLERDGEFARCFIKDNGIGISKEDQRKIFNRFERAVTLKQYGGLGLGLYIVNQIAEAHKGSVTVESIPGQGSKFIVELPVSK